MINLRIRGNYTEIHIQSSQSQSLTFIQGDKLLDIYKALKELGAERQEVYFDSKYLGLWGGVL